MTGMTHMTHFPTWISFPFVHIEEINEGTYTRSVRIHLWKCVICVMFDIE